MDKAGVNRSRGPGVTAAILALFLLVCLVQGATGSCLSYGHSCWGAVKQFAVFRINGKGSQCNYWTRTTFHLRPQDDNAPAISTHGKRSGRPPVTAPDWYLTKMLRRMAANAEMARARQLPSKTNDLSDIFQVEMSDEAPATEKLLTESQEVPMETGQRTMEAKPMLDEELLSKIKIWQLMREASEDN